MFDKEKVRAWTGQGDTQGPFQVISRVLRGTTDPAHKLKAAEMLTDKRFRAHVGAQDAVGATALEVLEGVSEILGTSHLNRACRDEQAARFILVLRHLVQPRANLFGGGKPPGSICGVPLGLLLALRRNLASRHTALTCFPDAPLTESRRTSYPLEGLFSTLVMWCGFKPPAWVALGALKAIFRVCQIRFNPYRTFYCIISRREHYAHSLSAAQALGCSEPCCAAGGVGLAAAQDRTAAVMDAVRRCNDGEGLERFYSLTGEDESTAEGRKRKGRDRKSMNEEKSGGKGLRAIHKNKAA